MSRINASTRCLLYFFFFLLSGMMAPHANSQNTPTSSQSSHGTPVRFVRLLLSRSTRLIERASKCLSLFCRDAYITLARTVRRRNRTVPLSQDKLHCRDLGRAKWRGGNMNSGFGALYFDLRWQCFTNRIAQVTASIDPWHNVNARYISTCIASKSRKSIRILSIWCFLIVIVWNKKKEIRNVKMLMFKYVELRAFVSNWGIRIVPVSSSFLNVEPGKGVTCASHCDRETKERTNRTLNRGKTTFWKPGNTIRFRT